MRPWQTELGKMWRLQTAWKSLRARQRPQRPTSPCEISTLRPAVRSVPSRSPPASRRSGWFLPRPATRSTRTRRESPRIPRLSSLRSLRPASLRCPPGPSNPWRPQLRSDPSCVLYLRHRDLALPLWHPIRSKVHRKQTAQTASASATWAPCRSGPALRCSRRPNLSDVPVSRNLDRQELIIVMFKSLVVDFGTALPENCAVIRRAFSADAHWFWP